MCVSPSFSLNRLSRWRDRMWDLCSWLFSWILIKLLSQSNMCSNGGNSESPQHRKKNGKSILFLFLDLHGFLWKLSGWNTAYYRTKVSDLTLNHQCKSPLPDQHNQSEPSWVSEKCQSSSCIRCWQPTSPMQCILGSAPPRHRRSACSYLVRYIQTQAKTVNNGGEQTTTTEPKNAPPLPMSMRRNKKTYEEKQCKKKELDHVRIIFGASFQRWRELRDL